MGESEADFRGTEAGGDEPLGGMKEEKDEEDISRKCNVNSQVFQILTPRKRFGIAESEEDCGKLKKESEAEKKSSEKDELMEVVGSLSQERKCV